MPESASWTGTPRHTANPDAKKAEKIAMLNKAIADADRYLTKYGILRDQFVDELTALGGV